MFVRTRYGGENGGVPIGRRGFDFSDDVDAILSNLPPKGMTAWVEDAIREKAGEERVIEDELRRLEERQRLLQAKLSDYKQKRTGGHRNAILTYLSKGGINASEAKQRAWCGNRIPWTEFQQVLSEVGR